MKITILNDGYRNCGGGLQLIKYANAMVRLGHKVTLAYTVGCPFDLIEILADRCYCPNGEAELPDADVIMCSTWYMARVVAGLPLSKGEKFNILQGFEQWSGTSDDIVNCWRLPVYKIAPSNYISDEVWLHTTVRTDVIPFGINFETFYPEPNRSTMDGSRLVVGALYNTSLPKRITDIVAVLEILHRSGLPVEFELFGFDPRPELPFPFTYHRQPELDQLRGMYNRCHVWLTMSDQEGLHVPPMEAMACGAVIVSSEIGGTRDYCLDNITGLRVAIGGREEAAAAVVSLLRDPGMWSRMSTAALEHIRSMGSETDNVHRMLDCFARRVAERDAGRPGLFDLVNVYQTTWKTMAVYMDQAETHIKRGEEKFATDLAHGVRRLLEEQARQNGVNFLSRHGELYARCLSLTGGAPELRARYSPNPDHLRRLAHDVGGVVQEHHSPATFDNHLRIYPTLRCNLRCPYCVNEQVGPTVKDHDLPLPEAWAEAVNREGRHVVFTGGEPFLYPKFTDLVNGVARHLMVRVYTNLCLDLAEPLDALRRETLFYVSWHPQPNADRERFLANWHVIQDNPLLSATVHAVRTPETESLLKDDLSFFERHGLKVTVDADQRDFIGSGQPAKRPAYCRRRIYLIAPDGTRYQCVSRLMRGVEPMENMLAEPLASDACLSLCPDWGNCAPCDSLGETAMAVIGQGDNKGKQGP
jgi:hypothetical protein